MTDEHGQYDENGREPQEPVPGRESGVPEGAPDGTPEQPSRPASRELPPAAAPGSGPGEREAAPRAPESGPSAAPASEPPHASVPLPGPEPRESQEQAPPAPAASGPAPSTAVSTGRQRLKAGLWPPRASRAQLIVALLLFVLGLGLAIQVSSTSDTSALRGARQEDLVRILDELDNRTQRLEDEKQRLEDQRRELENSSNQAEEARKQTEQKAAQLGVLAGTVAAQGPGITLTITDSKGGVEPDMLLDTLQELRAAGAEAIQINDLRVVADTYFTQGADGAVEIDGHKVAQPYRFKVIGNPQDLEPALNIPGGVVQTLEKEQATVDVTRSQKIVVDALRPPEQPDYAQSSSR
ncbi:DUF881 domain-containing protein [Streptomyces sp. NPDC058691]|uniref:DUF881 domain-containing protein n=1 Tax=Streptomyces sp. NPDC058691 TaxID=3346601 RepID=UPI0036497DD0